MVLSSQSRPSLRRRVLLSMLIYALVACLPCLLIAVQRADRPTHPPPLLCCVRLVLVPVIVLLSVCGFFFPFVLIGIVVIPSVPSHPIPPRWCAVVLSRRLPPLPLPPPYLPTPYRPQPSYRPYYYYYYYLSTPTRSLPPPPPSTLAPLATATAASGPRSFTVCSLVSGFGYYWSLPLGVFEH